MFELICPLTREQAPWLDEHVGKLFDRYAIKDEGEVKLDALKQEARDNWKVATPE